MEDQSISSGANNNKMNIDSFNNENADARNFDSYEMQCKVEWLERQLAESERERDMERRLNSDLRERLEKRNLLK